MRKLWHHIQLFVVMCHADYWTDFERLKEKYKKPRKYKPGMAVTKDADDTLR